MNRNNFVVRRRTTTCQKPPENYTEAISKFIVHVERRRREAFFTELYAMDETAVWFDCPDNRCIETNETGREGGGTAVGRLVRLIAQRL
jgi:hypothetical protein